MSNKSKHRLSLRGDLNVPTTEPIVQPPEEPNEPTQEKTMQASTETTTAASEPTAKQMAEMEALNAQRAREQFELQNQPPPDEPINIIEVAARGYDALHEAHRRQNEQKVPEYVPPPRTPRQMAALEEELAAGAAAQQRAEAHRKLHAPPPADPIKEGFNTPVYRPADQVPDPILPAGASAAGNRQFGSDA